MTKKSTSASPGPMPPATGLSATSRARICRPISLPVIIALLETGADGLRLGHPRYTHHRPREQEGISPADVVEHYHGRFVEGFLRFGLTFDLYTHTDTQNHWDVTHDLFLRHLERRYISRDYSFQLYALNDNRWLPIVSRRGVPVPVSAARAAISATTAAAPKTPSNSESAQQIVPQHRHRASDDRALLL